MRTIVILREAWLNVRTGAARRVAFLFVTSFGIGLFLVVSAVEIHRVESSYARFKEEGGTAFVNSRVGGISGHTCESMNATRGVQWASALKAAGKIVPVSLPGVPYDVVAVTRTLVRAVTGSDLSPANVNAGVLLPTDVANRLGLHTGDTLVAISGQQLKVAATIRIPWPDETLRSAVIEVVDEGGEFDKCIVSMASPGVDGSSLAAVAQDSNPDEVIVTGLNPSLGSSISFQGTLDARASRWLIFLPMLFALLAGFGVSWRRRLELSAQAHFGLARADIAAISVAEAMICLVGVSSFGLATWALCRLTIPNSSFRTMWDGESAVVLAGAWLGTLVSASATYFVATGGRMLTAFRER